MPYDPTLPTPAAKDLRDRHVGNLAQWKCQFCGLVEAGPLTLMAETQRYAAHEYQCPKRPANNLPGQYERFAYQSVHAAGLRRDLVALSCDLGDRRELLRCTWYFDWAGRRAHKAAIKELSDRMAVVCARAIALGLDSGWSKPDFTPITLS